MSKPSRAASGRSLATLLAGVVGLLALSAGPAAGHAAGPPPHARVSAEDRTVIVEWSAVADDAAAVGVAIGLLPEKAVDAYLGWGPFEDIPTAEEVRRLSDAHALRAYLLDNVQVRQAGQACQGTAEPARDFIADGARLEFICARPVEHVDLRITILHDQDPAYRTFAVDGTFQTTVHTASAPEHSWDFTGASALPPGRSKATRRVLPGAAAAVVLVTGAIVALRLRRPTGLARARRT